MQSVGEQLGIGNLQNFRPHAALVSADAVGVELELEGFNARSVEEAQSHLHPLWTTTQDGSLRNGGVELITNGGLGGEQLHAAFERVASLLERINYDASWRCSTHMHINMRDFTVNQVVRFMLVYAACEPVLFAHCGKFRYSSNFCVPIADSLPFHKKLISRLYDNVVKSRAAAQHTVKYTAMNFQPLFGDGRNRPALGTVEFRGGRPITTVPEFTLQANLLLSIKQYVRDFKGSEDEMLTALNEGVLNTVYANGCAAELTVDTAELDEALVHAWMLLKSYQKGMKTPQKSSPMPDLSATLAALRGNPGSAQAVARLSADQLRELGYWCAGDLTRGMIVNALPTTTQSHPRYMRLIERQFGSVVPVGNNWTPQETMVEMAQVMRAEFRYSEDIACHTAAIWYLNTLDGISAHVSPIRASHVLCYQQNEAERGRVSWLHRQRPMNNQPRFTWGAARFDYYEGLTRQQWNDIHLFSGTAGARDLFNWLLHTEVKLKRTGDLQRAINALGYEGVTLNPRANGTVYIQAALAMYFLKATGLSSADYIHGSSIGLYDKVAAVIDMMMDARLSVPFFKHYSHGGRGIIRCEHSMVVPLGHSVPRTIFENQPQRQTRVSASTGLPVY